MSERAVVVMGKLPIPGRVKTRLQLRSEVAARLYRAFLADVFERVDRALSARPGRAVFACALEPGDRLDAARALAPPGWSVIAQAGPDLGARMRHAWRSGQASRGVVLGSDVPTLPAERIVEALDALDEAEAVFVPALDGGYVLVGLREDTPALFEGIAWSTPEVLRATLDAAARSGLRVRCLAPQADVDLPEDLERLALEVDPGSATGRALEAEAWLSERARNT